MANSTGGHGEKEVNRARMGIFFVFIALTAGRELFYIEQLSPAQL